VFQYPFPLLLSSLRNVLAKVCHAGPIRRYKELPNPRTRHKHSNLQPCRKHLKRLLQLSLLLQSPPGSAAVTIPLLPLLSRRSHTTAAAAAGWALTQVLLRLRSARCVCCRCCLVVLLCGLCLLGALGPDAGHALVHALHTQLGVGRGSLDTNTVRTCQCRGCSSGEGCRNPTCQCTTHRVMQAVLAMPALNVLAAGSCNICTSHFNPLQPPTLPAAAMAPNSNSTGGCRSHLP
jgi:hypothetical protein